MKTRVTNYFPYRTMRPPAATHCSLCNKKLGQSARAIDAADDKFLIDALPCFDPIGGRAWFCSPKCALDASKAASELEDEYNEAYENEVARQAKKPKRKELEYSNVEGRARLKDLIADGKTVDEAVAALSGKVCRPGDREPVSDAGLRILAKGYVKSVGPLRVEDLETEAYEKAVEIIEAIRSESRTWQERLKLLLPLVTKGTGFVQPMAVKELETMAQLADIHIAIYETKKGGK